jgi:hypothetical protein
MDQFEDGILVAVRKKIRATMEQIADNVACGGCASFEEYKRQTGIIEGLALAERELLDLLEKYQES